MDDHQLLRYSRHILLDEIGIEGQKKILDANVLVIGAGGLGCAVLAYLASAGVGAITLVDHDTVDLTNLQRQILHTTERVGQKKVDSAAEAIKAINPNVQLTLLTERVSESSLFKLVEGRSIVLDCSDNFSTRHAVNHACVKQKIPLISGAAIGFDGQISVFDTRFDDAPCYACLFPPQTSYEEVQCSLMGVFAPLVGVIGTYQALEALKVLMGIGQTLKGRLVLFDGLASQWTTITVSRNLTCPVCGSSPAISS